MQLRPPVRCAKLCEFTVPKNPTSRGTKNFSIRRIFISFESLFVNRTYSLQAASINRVL
jgi:hypothetical protein